MIRWMVVAMLLVYGVADAGMSAPRRGVVAGGGGGSDVEYTIQGVTSGESTANVNYTTQWGQSWTIPSGGGGVLKAVTFRTTQTTPAGGIVCRVGTSAGQLNMSSSYVSGIGNFPSGTSGEFTIPITSGPTVVVGDVWYVVCQSDNSSSFRGLSYLSTNPYSGGQKYSTTARDWDLTGHQDSTHDFYFKYTVNQ